MALTSKIFSFYFFTKKTCSQKICYISVKNFFGYISGNETLLFLVRTQQTKIIMSRKFVILQEMETPTKLIIYSQEKSFSYIKGNKTPKKFFKFQGTYIQNPGMFRIRDIFRTLSNIYDERSCKNSYLAQFLALTLKTFLYFKFLTFTNFSPRKVKRIHSEKFSYIFL